MRIVILLVCLILLVPKIHGQQIKYRNRADSSSNYYLLNMPTDSIRGLLVLNARKMADSSVQYAMQSGIAILSVVPTNNTLDNLLDERVLRNIDETIGEVTATYKIPRNHVVIGGMSVAGTGALRYVLYCNTGRSGFKIKPAGVFCVDAPLDYQRLFREAENAVKRGYNTNAVTEGKMLVRYFKKMLKGTPQTNLKAYQDASPFCYTAQSVRKARLLLHTSVKVYTEPDINWWINNRRKDYYDINAIDLAAFINELLLQGNKKAGLVVSANRGVQADSHPHSWSIISEREVLNWCLQVFDGITD